MFKKTFFLLCSFVSIASFGQIRYEPAYFITNNGTKTNCFIRNVNWRYNPTKFDYKLAENGSSQIGNIENITEFVIEKECKYLRDDVGIDRSSHMVGNISGNREPRFNNETLFLKVIIEGQASLYEYKDNNLKRYFYKIGDSDITQLVHKPFMYNGAYIRENNDFRDQLLNDLKCDAFNFVEMQKIEYDLKDLFSVFQNYNKYVNSEYTMIEKEVDETKIHINLRPGVSFSKLEVENSRSVYPNSVFGTETNFRFGVEAELSLLFHKRKWSLTMEPTYEYFKSSQTTIPNSTSVNNPAFESAIDYACIAIPLGVRHYLYLNNDSKFFIDAQLNFGITLKSSMNQESREFEPGWRNYISVGGGFKYSDYSIAFRYGLDKTLGDINANEFHIVSFIFGYTVF